MTKTQELQALLHGAEEQCKFLRENLKRAEAELEALRAFKKSMLISEDGNEYVMVCMLKEKIGELTKEMEEAPVVYQTQMDGEFQCEWWNTYTKGDTHKARLVRIEPINESSGTKGK